MRKVPSISGYAEPEVELADDQNNVVSAFLSHNNDN